MSTNPLGISAGSVADPESNNLSNSYTDIPDTSVDAIADRVQPRQVTTGVTRAPHITAGSDGKPQVLVGPQKKFGNGLFVAQEGTDVVTNEDPNKLIFNSNQNIFKIAKIVPYTYTFTTTDAANNYANFSVTHGLGYAPKVEGSFINSTDSLKRQLPYDYRSPTSSYFATAGKISASVYIFSISDTVINVGIKVFDAIGLSWLLANSTLTFKFYCSQETIVS